MTTFSKYFARRRPTDDPTGDFAADFRRDPMSPVNSLEDLLNALHGRRIWDYHVLATAKAAWEEYKQHNRWALA